MYSAKHIVGKYYMVSPCGFSHVIAGHITWLVLCSYSGMPVSDHICYNTAFKRMSADDMVQLLH